MRRDTPARRLDPYGWIDQQRDAGLDRGNIFTDILAASMQARAERQGWDVASIARRQERIAEIKKQAAQADAKVSAVDPDGPPPVPSFSQLMEGWKRS